MSDKLLTNLLENKKNLFRSKNFSVNSTAWLKLGDMGGMASQLYFPSMDKTDALAHMLYALRLRACQDENQGKDHYKAKLTALYVILLNAWIADRMLVLKEAPVYNDIYSVYLEDSDDNSERTDLELLIRNLECANNEAAKIYTEPSLCDYEITSEIFIDVLDDKEEEEGKINNQLFLTDKKNENEENEDEDEDEDENKKPELRFEFSADCRALIKFYFGLEDRGKNAIFRFLDGELDKEDEEDGLQVVVADFFKVAYNQKAPYKDPPNEKGFNDNLRVQYWCESFIPTLFKELPQFNTFIEERKRAYRPGRIFNFLLFTLIYGFICFMQIFVAVSLGLASFGVAALVASIVAVILAFNTSLCNAAFADTLYRSFFKVMAVIRALFNEIGRCWRVAMGREQDNDDGRLPAKYRLPLFIFLLLLILGCCLAIAFVFHFITYVSIIDVFHFTGSVVVAHILGGLCDVIMVFITIKSLLEIVGQFFINKNDPFCLLGKKQEKDLNKDDQKEPWLKKLFANQQGAFIIGAGFGLFFYTPFWGALLSLAAYSVTLQLTIGFSILGVTLLLMLLFFREDLLSSEKVKKIFFDSIPGFIFILVCTAMWSMFYAAFPVFLSLLPAAVAASSCWPVVGMIIHVFFFLGNVLFGKAVAENAYRWLCNLIFVNTLFLLIRSIWHWFLIERPYPKTRWKKLSAKTGMALLLLVFTPIFAAFYVVDTLFFIVFHGYAGNADKANFIRWVVDILSGVQSLNLLKGKNPLVIAGYFLLTLFNYFWHLVAGIFSVILFSYWCPAKFSKLFCLSIYGEEGINSIAGAKRFSDKVMQLITKIHFSQLLLFVIKMPFLMALGLILLPFYLLWNIIHGFIIVIRAFLNAIGNAAIIALAAIQGGAFIPLILTDLVAGVLCSIGAMGANVLFFSLFAFSFVYLLSYAASEYGHRYFNRSSMSLMEVITLYWMRVIDSSFLVHCVFVLKYVANYFISIVVTLIWGRLAAEQGKWKLSNDKVKIFRSYFALDSELLKNRKNTGLHQACIKLDKIVSIFPWETTLGDKDQDEVEMDLLRLPPPPSMDN